VKLSIHTITAACAIAAIFALAPSDAAAQRRGVAVRGRPAGVVRAPVVVRPRTTVAVGVGVGRYYRPYYYSPYYPYGYGWYGYSSWGYGPYPGYYGYYGPSYYGPGYGGYYGGYDLSSSLRLEVKPREAEVFVDGYYAGIVDKFDGVFQRLNAEPGEHEIELYLPGYRSVRQRLYLQPGVTSNVKLNMDPLAPGDPAPIRPEPVAPPRTSARGNDRPEYAGPPVRRVPAPGEDPRQGRVPPPSDDPRQGSVQANRGFGELALRVQPGDAEVLIDGERWSGPADERLTLQLGEGLHHIEVRKDGYRSYLSDITVRDGRTISLNIALTRQ